MTERKSGSDAAPEPFSVIDYVQLACMGRRSIRMQLVSDEPSPGEILILAGEVWHARDGRGEGAPAFRRLVLTECVIHIEGVRGTEQARTVEASWEHLLIDAALEKDEALRAERRSGFPSAPASEEHTTTVEQPSPAASSARTTPPNPGPTPLTPSSQPRKAHALPHTSATGSDPVEDGATSRLRGRPELPLLTREGAIFSRRTTGSSSPPSNPASRLAQHRALAAGFSPLSAEDLAAPDPSQVSPAGPVPSALGSTTQDGPKTLSSAAPVAMSRPVPSSHAESASPPSRQLVRGFDPWQLKSAALLVSCLAIGFFAAQWLLSSDPAAHVPTELVLARNPENRSAAAPPVSLPAPRSAAAESMSSQSHAPDSELLPRSPEVTVAPSQPSNAAQTPDFHRTRPRAQAGTAPKPKRRTVRAQTPPRIKVTTSRLTNRRAGPSRSQRSSRALVSSAPPPREPSSPPRSSPRPHGAPLGTGLLTAAPPAASVGSPGTVQARIDDFRIQNSPTSTEPDPAILLAQDEFAKCYASATKTAKKDGLGRVSVDVTRSPDGTLSDPVINGASLPGLAACIRSVCSQLRTSPSPDQRSTHLSWIIDFAP